jgi:hypothetical protein
MEETEKSEDQKDKSLINQLSKTIPDNYKVLDDFGLTPQVLSRIKSIISTNYFNSQRNKGDVEVNALITNIRNSESGFYPDTDNEDPPLECEDPQAVF